MTRLLVAAAATLTAVAALAGAAAAAVAIGETRRLWPIDEEEV